MKKNYFFLIVIMVSGLFGCATTGDHTTSLNAETFFNQGVAAAQSGRHQDALEAFTQAIKLKPDYAEAYSNLGYVYSSLGRHQEAIEACEQALKMKPDFVDALEILFCFYLGYFIFHIFIDRERFGVFLLQAILQCAGDSIVACQIYSRIHILANTGNR